jgi:hypothetical protein
VSLQGVDVKEGHVLLERVNVNMEDASLLVGLPSCWDPGNITIQNENIICRLETLISAVTAAQPGTMIG